MAKSKIIPTLDDLDIVYTWTLDSSLKTVYANNSAKQLAENPFDGILAKDIKNFKNYILGNSKEDGIYLPWVTSNKENTLWLKWVVKQQEDHHFLFGLDVTDVKTNELNLAQILDSIADLILVKGKDSKIVWANQAFQNHYHLNREQLKEITDAPFVSPDFTKQYIIDDKKVWDSGQPLLIECEPVVRFDGVVRKFQTLKTPIFGPHENVIFTVGISRDITEKIEHQEKSITASKMAAIGEMAGGMAHEINNPIAVIAGKSFILRRLLNKAVEVKKDLIINYLDTIDLHIERIAEVINCLRRLSVDDDFEGFSQTDVKKLINDTLMLCELKIKEKGTTIILDIPENVAIEVRIVQLSQALLNMITNAADAAENSIDKWIKIGTKVEDGMLKIMICDSGAGVPDEILGKVFQPFFTTKEIGKGTGLGLSFSLSVAKNHHGNLRVATEISNSCFVLELPLKRDN